MAPDPIQLSPAHPAPVQVIGAAAEPSWPSAEAEAYYAESLRELARLGVPFLLSGTYAVSAYTGIRRATKDLDVFCKAGDFPRILGHFQSLGHEIEIEDERWLGKIRRGPLFFDVIFASSNGTMPVNDQWFEHARQIEVWGTPVRIVAPTELIWSKAFIQDRYRFDGSDVAHVILRQHEQVDWRRLLTYMEAHWEVLLAQLVNFRWIYPAERDVVPRWLMDELLERLRLQLDLPPPQMRVCRGRMFSRQDYQVDVREWGFADVGGEGGWRND
jgi:hypothetical protein